MSFTLRWANHALNLDERTHIMGVLNVTPDSFSDGGKYLELNRALEHAVNMARDGADVIDVGGQSTRPYSQRLAVDEELERVVPVIEVLSKELTVPISIDTYRGEVAREAIKAGASIINDISSLRFDPRMGSIAADAGVPLILMHMKGTPEDMQKDPQYKDVVSEILAFLRDAIKQATGKGVKEELIIVDPGIGFGKTLDHNLMIIKALKRFSALNRPVLLGTSNKAFIGRILDKEVDQRVTGTMASISAAIMNGAHMVRVHNVKAAVDTVRVIDAIQQAKTK